MSSPHPENFRSSMAGHLVRLILSRRAMIVLDAVIIVLGVCTMIYALLRYFNILGSQPFIEDCSFTLDVFSGMADIFVFYGVALESRSHLVRRVLGPEEAIKDADTKLDGVSEYSGIILVVMGLLLELTTQIGNLAVDAKLDDWTFFPMCIFGFIVVGVTVQQLIMHLVATRRKERSASSST